MLQSNLLEDTFPSKAIIFGVYSEGCQYKGADVCAMVTRLWLLYFYLRPAMPPSFAMDMKNSDLQGISGGTVTVATDVIKRGSKSIDFSSLQSSNRNPSNHSGALSMPRTDAEGVVEEAGDGRYIIDSLHTLCYLWKKVELRSMKESPHSMSLKGYDVAYTEEVIDIEVSDETSSLSKDIGTKTLSSKTTTTGEFSTASRSSGVSICAGPYQSNTNVDNVNSLGDSPQDHDIALPNTESSAMYLNSTSLPACTHQHTPNTFHIGLINPLIHYQINNFDVLFDHPVIELSGRSSNSGERVTTALQSVQRIVLLASTYHPNERSRNLFSSGSERHFVLLAIPSLCGVPSNVNKMCATPITAEDAIRAISNIMNYRILFESFFAYLVLEDTSRKDLRKGQRFKKKHREFSASHDARKMNSGKGEERESDKVSDTSAYPAAQQVINDGMRGMINEDKDADNPLVTEMREDEALAEESLRSALRQIVFAIPLSDTLLNSNIHGLPPAEVDRRHFALKAVSFVSKMLGAGVMDDSVLSRTKVYVSAMCCYNGLEKAAERPLGMYSQLPEGHERIEINNGCGLFRQSSVLLADILGGLVNKPDNGQDHHYGGLRINPTCAISDLTNSNRTNPEIDAYIQCIVRRYITSASLLVVCGDNVSNHINMSVGGYIHPIQSGIHVSYVHTTNNKLFAELVFMKRKQNVMRMTDNISNTIDNAIGNYQCSANTVQIPSHLFLDEFALGCLSSWAQSNHMNSLTNTVNDNTPGVLSMRDVTTDLDNNRTNDNPAQDVVMAESPSNPTVNDDSHENAVYRQVPVLDSVSGKKEKRRSKIKGYPPYHPVSLNPTPNPYLACLHEMIMWCGVIDTSNTLYTVEDDDDQREDHSRNYSIISDQRQRLSPPPCSLHTHSLTSFLATGYTVMGRNVHRKHTTTDVPHASDYLTLQCTPCGRWFLGVSLRKIWDLRCPRRLCKWIKRDSTNDNVPMGNRTGESIVRTIGAGAVYEVDN